MATTELLFGCCHLFTVQDEEGGALTISNIYAAEKVLCLIHALRLPQQIHQNENTLLFLLETDLTI